jgi:hypothetical protein
MAGPAARLTVNRPSLALIGHLETAEAYRDLLNCVRGGDLPQLPLEEIEQLLRATDPMPLCDLTLRSMRGAAVSARYIDVGLLPDAQTGLREAMARIRMAAREAAVASRASSDSSRVRICITTSVCPLRLATHWLRL